MNLLIHSLIRTIKNLWFNFSITKSNRKHGKGNSFSLKFSMRIEERLEISSVCVACIISADRGAISMRDAWCGGPWRIVRLFARRGKGCISLRVECGWVLAMRKTCPWGRDGAGKRGVNTITVRSILYIYIYIHRRTRIVLFDGGFASRLERNDTWKREIKRLY